MANVTTTLQQVRPYVRTAAFPLILLFLFVYSSLLALSMQPVALQFEVDRYWCYFNVLHEHLSLAAPVSILMICGVRSGLTGVWLLATAKMVGWSVGFRPILSILLASELVFLIPSWLHVIWITHMQGNLNVLPVGSFEPLVFPLAHVTSTTGLSAIFLNSYWVMYVVLIATMLSQGQQATRSRGWLWIILSLLLSTVLWEFGRKYLFGFLVV